METLPVWAQDAGILAVALVSAIIGVFRYLKTQAKTETATASSGTASVISASLVDSKTLRDVADTLRENQVENDRISKRAHKDSQDLKEAINELNESVIIQTDTMMNLVRIVNRDANRHRMEVDS